MFVRALIVIFLLAAAFPALGARGREQAEHQLARLSGRRLRRPRLQIRQRREPARSEIALPHDRHRKTECGGRGGQRRAAAAGQHRDRRQLVSPDVWLTNCSSRASRSTPAKYYIIMPDALGRGGSSKPSDGLKGRFPHYRYHDMVDLTHRLVTDGLKVAHLRLIIGSSLGCMQQFLWAEWYPDLMDGTVGMSCQPVEISGRNYMLRHGAAEAIRHDPDWNNGEYDKNPTHYMYAAAGNDLTESPVRIQEEAPTMEAAKALYDKRLAAMLKNGDANNTLYEIESIYDYSPEADLPKIKAHVLLINNVEDFADPPTLGTVERAFKKIAHGTYVLTPYGKDTHGHFTHYYAAVWKPYLVKFMAGLPPA